MAIKKKRKSVKRKAKKGIKGKAKSYKAKGRKTYASKGRKGMRRAAKASDVKKAAPKKLGGGIKIPIVSGPVKKVPPKKP